MLRNQGIRTKLLAVLALPIVALIVLATVVSLQAFGQARKAGEVEKMSTGADTLGELVTAIQSERSISAQLLEKKPVASQVTQARKQTDAALVRVRGLLGSVDIARLSPQAVAAEQVAQANHGQLDDIRSQVDSGYAQSDRISSRYSSMIAADIALSARIGAGLENRAIGRQLSVYSAAQTLAEVATQERELVASMIAQGTVTQETATALAGLGAQENQASSAFRLDATKKQKSDLDAAEYLPVQSRARYSTIKADVASKANGDRIKLDAAEWRNVSNDRLTALQKLLPTIATNVVDEAAAASSSATNQALLVLVGGLLLVGVLLGLGLVLARGITRPLRHLTRVAGEVADELPRMVERMATPGEGPNITLPEIPFRGEDEVGQLAAAFREVNDTTVRVAEEQAALRASIAEMFVNVARRNHVLLSRQLSFIDQLERSEENPDTLDNLFRLDHLATRMRRNAESLIVLAGIDAGRRLRRPMPLSDVIRTAVSEIERYDRVDLALQADPPMVGHVALTTAHLLAELLENATQFSNPDTRVIASTAFSSRGVRITITDLGLGMTWDEINEANQRIASPPATEVVGSQRLGFYVVGRLARRLDASVELKPGRAQGTVVTIDLPPALFVSGTVVETMPPADQLPVEPVDTKTDVEAGPTGTSPEGTDNRPSTAPSGLPSRGSVTPSLPSVSASSAAPAAPPAPLGDIGLPRRSGASAPAPVASGESPAAAAEAPAGPRSGMFSSFRSRRAVESEVSAVAPAEQQVSLEALAQELPEFVPTLDTSTPALPQRSEASAALTQDVAEVADDETTADLTADVDDLTADNMTTDVDVAADVNGVATDIDDVVTDVNVTTDLDDVAAADAFAPVLEDEPVAPAVPGLADEPAPALAVVDTPSEETFAPVSQAPSPIDPLDDAWRPDPSDLPADQPLVALLADEPVLEPVDAQPAVAVDEVAVDEAGEPVASVAGPDDAAEPVADESHGGSQARSTLSELARQESAPAPAEEVPSEPEPVPAVPLTAIGAPAMDILPTRSAGRGLRLRRTSRPKVTRPRAVEVGRHAQLPAPADTGPLAAAPAPTESWAAVPAPTLPAPTFSEPVFSEPASSEPTFSVPAQAPDAAAPQEPVAAPSSLFAPPPTPVDDAPQPEPTPAFPADSVPALVAAQSLRERSAMASEALSELSALSSYRPEAMTAASAPESLARRTPQATPAAQLAQPQEPQGPRRANRNAADVRSMLSGFRAGVERGRTSPAAPGATRPHAEPEGDS